MSTTTTYERTEPGHPIGSKRIAVYELRETENESLHIVRHHSKNRMSEREPGLIAEFTPMDYAAALDSCGGFAELCERCISANEWELSVARGKPRQPAVVTTDMLDRHIGIYGIGEMV